MNKNGAYLSFNHIKENIRKNLNYEGELIISGINVDYDSEMIYINYYAEIDSVTRSGEFKKLNINKD